MVPEFGLFALILAFCTAIAVVILPLIGLSNPKYAYLQNVVRPGVFSQCFFIVLSFVTLTYSFVVNDFSVQYVAQNSFTHLPLIYKMCAIWGAHEGSLLLWALILSLWTVAVTILSKRTEKSFDLLVLVILMAVNAGFLFLLLQTSNPYLRLLPFSPTEGADLNPLLQDPGFVLHPPILYMGYVGFAVPFAYALAYLALGNKNIPWATLARSWALLAWGFLTVGIALGSWWAYYELGWGGWWFWDPVENASFMPWLLGAALIHALYVCSKREAFIPWCLGLAICGFVLSLMGTFLVRSGILSSVHSFASDPKRGLYILSYLAMVVVASFTLYIARVHRFKSQNNATLLSRESTILFGNMLLVVATSTVLLGTLYPLILEVLGLGKISVGPPYFNVVFLPLMMPVMIAMIFAPYLQWRSDTLSVLWQTIKKFLLPLTGLAIIFCILAYQKLPVFALTAIVLAGGVIAATLFKVVKLWPCPWHKWGMIFAHIGLGISVLGVALTSSLETEKEAKLFVGQSIQMGQDKFLFESVRDFEGPNYIAKIGHFAIQHHDKTIANVYPEKRYFIAREIVMTETGISPGLLRDFYIAMGEPFEDGSWSVRVYVKPFVRWIWMGALFIALGAWISGIATLRGKI